jgi:hypothetical protein
LSRERFTISWPNSIGAATKNVVVKIRLGTLLSALRTAIEPAESAAPSRKPATSRRPSRRVPAVNMTSSTAKNGPAVWSVMSVPIASISIRPPKAAAIAANGELRRRPTPIATIVATPSPASSREPSSGLQKSTSSQNSTANASAISASSSAGGSAATRAETVRGMTATQQW